MGSMNLNTCKTPVKITWRCTKENGVALSIRKRNNILWDNRFNLKLCHLCS